MSTAPTATPFFSIETAGKPTSNVVPKGGQIWTPIRGQYSKPVDTSLIIALLDRGALDAAKVIHEWGAPTVSSMDGASAGREAHAKDALRIMVACRSANDVDSALEVFHRLDVVRLAFPEEAVLLQAKVYGINLLQDLGSDPRVRQVITTSIEQDPALTFS